MFIDNNRFSFFKLLYSILKFSQCPFIEQNVIVESDILVAWLADGIWWIDGIFYSGAFASVIFRILADYSNYLDDTQDGTATVTAISTLDI